ncbi:MAG: hypothetical protein IKR92_02730 [Alphaproteobacteria bacterium]|nr:hypothetical protein [Alphaproteobacteria bacterium]
MKTRKIISVLRAFFERIALIAVALAVVVFALQQYSLCNFAYGCWPIVATFLACYVALTLGEDYLNNRIIHRGFH